MAEARRAPKDRRFAAGRFRDRSGGARLRLVGKTEADLMAGIFERDPVIEVYCRVPMRPNSCVAFHGGPRVRWAKLMFDMKVRVLRHQSRSGQVRTESCERAGNVVFEA